MVGVGSGGRGGGCSSWRGLARWSVVLEIVLTVPCLSLYVGPAYRFDTSLLFVSTFLFINSSFSLIEIPSTQSSVMTFSLVKFQ